MKWLMNYSIRRSDRAKKLYLRVKPNGAVELVIPRFVPEILGRQFARQHHKWIEKHSRKQKNALPLISTESGSRIFFRGEGYILVFFKALKPRVEIEGSYLKVYYREKDSKRALIEKFYREQALVYLTERVHFFAQKLGVSIGTIRVKNQKTRWGSCSAKGNLNFNWKIIRESDDIIDYLVIHEVCHRKEMNHSARFWALVESFDADYSVHVKYLRKAF